MQIHNTSREGSFDSSLRLLSLNKNIRICDIVTQAHFLRIQLMNYVNILISQS